MKTSLVGGRFRPVAAIGAGIACACLSPLASAGEDAAVHHVLLISVDGMHQVDLDRYAAEHPLSAFARLQRHGVTYSNASASRPSDSFPGLLAFMTGASPRTHGVFYDDSYDRSLYAPGSNCQGSPGTEAQFAENIDYDLGQLDGGGPAGSGHIDPTQLPLRLEGQHCLPVYPHNYLRANTVMEIIHAAGGRTAWADKHPAYEIVAGPSGRGLDELFTPEINSTTVPGNPGADWTTDPALTRQYDELKVDAVLNQIQGLDHTGARRVGVPALFGMNFQAVSVAQKVSADGYLGANAAPSRQLELSLDYVDGALGRMLDAVESQHLGDDTLFIVGAKHGQSPIDPTALHMLSGSANPRLLPGHADVADPANLLANAGVPLAQETADDVALIWLKDQRQLPSALAVLEADQAGPNQARIDHVYAGTELLRLFGDPAGGRTPDIIVQPIPGTVYSGSKKKIAEHGGFAPDDTHVLLVVANPGIGSRTVSAPVENKQVAPTILRALGLDPSLLDGVRIEHTRVLPGWGLETNR